MNLLSIVRFFSPREGGLRNAYPLIIRWQWQTKVQFKLHPGEQMILLGLLRDNWYNVTEGSVHPEEVTLKSLYSVCKRIFYSHIDISPFDISLAKLKILKSLFVLLMCSFLGQTSTPIPRIPLVNGLNCEISQEIRWGAFYLW